jgi:WXG100 family type VII secretion target
VTATAQANELEAWFASVPGLVQDVLHEPYVWMDDKLRMVAGDPQALLDAGARYDALRQGVETLLGQDRSDVEALGGVWTGEAYEAFRAHLGEVEATLQTVSAQLGAMPDVLDAGARACVEGANMIVEIVVALLTLALGTLAVNVALSVLTFGASLAAMVAEWLAEAAVAAARVLQVLEKVAAVLTKVAEVLTRISRILAEVAEFFRTQKIALAEVKALSKGLSAQALGNRATFMTMKWLLGKEIWAVTGGQVHIPGSVAPIRGAAGDYVDGYQAASAAVDAADAASTP